MTFMVPRIKHYYRLTSLKNTHPKSIDKGVLCLRVAGATASLFRIAPVLLGFDCLTHAWRG